ncbi:MAG TPA: hypothetical protein VKR22_03125 [Acidimicrobiales bacterium]|nr:hypothetical protein [Acidimicrobiales bacterium]
MLSGLHPALKALTVVLAVVGALAVIAGIMYLALPSHSLPSFFPAHYKHSKAHAMKHGYAALALGVVLIVGAVAVPWTARRSQHT